jgi:hypothetical protein
MGEGNNSLWVKAGISNQAVEGNQAVDGNTKSQYINKSVRIWAR